MNRRSAGRRTRLLLALLAVTACADGFFGPSPSGLVYDLVLYKGARLPALDTVTDDGTGPVTRTLVIGQVFRPQATTTRLFDSTSTYGFGDPSTGYLSNTVIFNAIYRIDSAGTTTTQMVSDTGSLVPTSGPYLNVALGWCRRACNGGCQFSPGCPGGVLPVYVDSSRLDVPHFVPGTVTLRAATDHDTAIVMPAKVYGGRLDYHFERH
ncbi:MAG TPA: hypothetical protein VGI83_04010 [Gemmatimonadales bacterium]